MPAPHPSTASLCAPRFGSIVAALAFACLAVACGADDIDAPPVDLPPAPCPTLDQTLNSTLQAAQGGELEPIARVVRDLDGLRGGDGITTLLRAVIALLRALPADTFDLITVDLLRALVADLQEPLSALLSPLTALDPDTPADRDRLLVLDAAGEMIVACPEGSLTGAVDVLLSSPDLIAALQDTLRDPTVVGLVDAFPPPDGSDSNRRGFAVLIDTLVSALLSANFDFDALLDLIAPFFPIDAPPLSTLLDQLRPVLAPPGLDTLRTALTCIDAVERTTSSGEQLDGGLLVGDLLYTLVASQNQALAGLLDTLQPLLTRAADPDLLALIEAVVDAIAQDSELRADLLDVLAFTLDIDRTHDLLLGVQALLDAGSLSEIVDLLDAIFITGTCTDPASALEARLDHAHP